MASNAMESGAHPTQLKHCTVEEIVTLLTFKTVEDEKEKESKHNAVDGVLSHFESQAANNIECVTGIGRWKEKLVEWLRNDKVDGEKLEDDITWKEVADALLGDKVQGCGLKELKDLRRPLKPHCQAILGLLNDDNIARFFQAKVLQNAQTHNDVEMITEHETKEKEMPQSRVDPVRTGTKMEIMEYGLVLIYVT